MRIIDFTDDDGQPLVEVGHTLEGSSLPGVVVDAPTGAALQAAVGQTATLDITSSTVADHASVNVLGEVAGHGTGRVIVLAHHDSWHPSESAYDNALGVGAMILLAQELAHGPPPRRSVLFIATGAEEQGLQGANAWVAAHEAELGDVSLVLNLDVMWAGEGTYRVAGTVPEHRERAMSEALAAGIPDAIDAGQPGLGSDHLPFQTRGIDTFWAERWPYRHYHTTRDTHDRVDWDGAWAAYQVNRAVLWEAVGR